MCQVDLAGPVAGMSLSPGLNEASLHLGMCKQAMIWRKSCRTLSCCWFG